MAQLNMSPWGLFYSAWSVIQPYWPYIAALILLIMGLAAAYLLVTTVGALIRRRVLSRQFRAQPGIAQPDGAAPPAASEPERFAVLPDGVSTVSLERSFADVLDLLKRHVPSRTFRYEIPWFLSLGDEGAGKTSLFASAPIHRPFSSPGTMPQSGAACSWWFFDTAIVLDLAGRAVLGPGGRAPEGTLWKRFIKLVQASRPQRPLDGVILSISARDLLDQSAEGSNALLLKAETLHNRLWELQKTLEINVPIYVVVTQCDALDGFPEFCAALPAELSATMLGWSSPYGVEASYNPRWVAEIFEETAGDITAIETDLFANRPLADERGRLALLPESFQHLRRPMEQLLSRIFTPTAYHEVFVLRGVYFTGASAPTAGDEDDGYRALTALPAGNGPSSAAPPVAFVRDLLEQKIFQELGLARPVSRALFVSTKRTRLAQAALAGTAVLLTGAVVYESGTLADRARVIGSTVEETRRDLIRFEERARMGGLSAEAAADPPTIARLLSAAVLVEREDLSTSLLPTSLLSRMDGDLETLVSIAMQRMMLKSLRGGLLQQLNTAVGGLGANGMAEAPRSGAVNMDSRAAPRSIEQLPGYQRLSRYIDHLAALRENLDRYERLRRTGSFSDLASLTQYVFGVSPPSILKDNERFRSNAIRMAKLQEINVDPLQSAAGVGALQYAEDLYDDLFARNSLSFWSKRLNAQLEALRASAVSNRISAKDLQDIHYSFQQLRSVADAPVNRWILSAEAKSPPEIDMLLGRIAVSVLLSGRTFEEIGKTIATRSMALRDEMLGQEMPFVGRVFVQTQAGAPFQLNERFHDLMDPMEVLLSQGFMADLGTAKFEPVSADSHLMWDTTVLNQAKQYKVDYSTYVAQRLSDFPKPLHSALRIAVGRRMVSNVMTLTARAVSVSNSEDTFRSAPTDRSLADQVASFLTVAPIIQELMDGVRPIAEPGSTLDIEQLLNAQSVQILNRVTDVLASEEPYKPLVDNISRWDGEPGALARAFGAANGGELASMIASARQRVRVLAKSYAKPALDYIKDPYRIGAPGAERAVQDWLDILAAIDRYDQQIPNNALSELEKYVLYVGNAVGRDNCREVLGERVGMVGGGDYFSRIHVQSLSRLNERCLRFQAQQIHTVMLELGGSFSQLLAGRFPFVRAEDALTAPDADPADIRRFYRLYDDMKPRIEQELAADKRRNSPLRQFVEQVEGSRAFLADIVDPEGSGSLKLSAEVTFGVNRVNEVGGDQIIEWSMRSGSSSAGSGTKERTLAWSYSEPVEISLRWASGSDYRPRRADGRPGAPTVTDDKATIIEKGPWSLLRLLVARGVRNPESFDPMLRGQQVIRITVPTRTVSGTAAPDTVVFLAARVTAGAGGKAPAKGVPAFPIRFPDVRPTSF